MAACPICRDVAQSAPSDSGKMRSMFKCRTCGTYEVTIPEGSETVMAVKQGDRRLAGLSAYIRGANKRGEMPVLSSDNWESLARGHLHTSVNEKLRRLLDHFGDLTSRPGEKIEVDGSHDYPLLDAASSSEVGYLIETLIERGDVKRAPSGVVITAQGWEKLDPTGGEIPRTCVVAMSFKPELDATYDSGIRPSVVDDCGIDVIRVDRVEHSENINDKILADIWRAQFLIADFTFHPAGVYFDAGLGLGLGKLVIWTCRKDQFKGQVHFDTRPYNHNHILWESPGELRVKLTNRIRALVPNARML